jgi:hypothetical protein
MPDKRKPNQQGVMDKTKNQTYNKNYKEGLL